jgi:hypothetical protein
VEQRKDEAVGDIERFIHGLTLEGVSRHIFLSSMMLWSLFHRGRNDGSGVYIGPPPISRTLVSYFFTEWPHQVALAVERAPHALLSRWLNEPIGPLLHCLGPFRSRYSFEVSEDAFLNFGGYVQRVSRIVGNKVRSSFLEPLSALCSFILSFLVYCLKTRGRLSNLNQIRYFNTPFVVRPRH